MILLGDVRVLEMHQVCDLSAWIRGGQARLLCGCPVQANLSVSGLTFRLILRSPELGCESLPGFDRVVANNLDL
jgi:hypothetical protein